MDQGFFGLPCEYSPVCVRRAALHKYSFDVCVGFLSAVVRVHLQSAINPVMCNQP